MKLVPPPDPETRAAWDRADVIRDGIVAQYLDGDTRPWVVAYSGGKDSTLLVHLTFQALSRIRPGLRTRPVYVVCSDTRVETPAIVEHVYRSIAEMQSAARALSPPRKLPHSAAAPERHLLGADHRPRLSTAIASVPLVHRQDEDQAE